MEDEGKTKEQLINELVLLRQQISRLEALETEHNQMHETLQRDRDRALNYLDIADIIIVAIDSDQKVTFINKKGCALLEYEEKEVLGRNFFDTFIPKRLRNVLRMPFNWLMAGRIELMQRQSETILLTKNRGEISVTWHFSVLTDETGNITGAIGSGADITEHKQAEGKIYALSLVDELTGLYNRRGFLNLSKQQLSLSSRTKKGMVLLFADLDGMKRINDTLGHNQGDVALIDTANILRQTFRESDIIARIGGDEFAVVIIESCDSNTELLTTRLNENLKSHNEKESRAYKLSLSIGIANYDAKSPCSIDTLIATADKLMYEHKNKHL